MTTGVRKSNNKKTGFELAMDDVKNGRIEEFSSVEEMMKEILE